MTSPNAMHRGPMGSSGGSGCSAALLALATLLWPGAAEASGGMFRDGSPESLPVEQASENILFVLDEGRVETHIQIRYEGDPARFGWVIPLAAVPELSVGSDALFQTLLDGTVPSYGFTTTSSGCRAPASGSSPEPSGPWDDGGSVGDPGGPEIVLQQTIGAFHMTVLAGGTADEVQSWLLVNGYLQHPEVAPILEEYLQEGMLFGAVQLTADANLHEIHPIVLTVEGTEPSVPLRLTRVAATEDMKVRTFFLAEDRVAPTNYRHVVVNPLGIDWLSRGANYEHVITAAVDARHADGRAFVTEFAGPTAGLRREGLFDERWDADAFASRTALDVVEELEVQGLVSCPGGAEGCLLQHPMIDAITRELLLPQGLLLGAYHDCPECYVGGSPFDPLIFANAIEERIIAPGRHAVELLERWPHVTRLYTTISPHEMFADPKFASRPDLPDVPNEWTADRLVRCDGDSVFTLPDGRELYLPAGSPWPGFGGEMPRAETIEELPAQGAAIELANHTERIDELLASHNAELGWPLHGCAACRVARGPRGAPPLGALLMCMCAVGVARRRRGARVTARNTGS